MAPRARAARHIIVPVALALSAALTACSTIDACPLVGWSSLLRVTASGPVPDGAVLEVCVEDTCVIEGPALTVAPLDEPLVPVPPLGEAPSPGEVEGPGDDADPGGDPHHDITEPEPAPFLVTASDDGGWSVSYLLSTPEQVTLRLRASSGAAEGADAPPGVGRILTQTTTTLDWRRVGGSARCGGPHEANAVLPAASD